MRLYYEMLFEDHRKTPSALCEAIVLPVFGEADGR